MIAEECIDFSLYKTKTGLNCLRIKKEDKDNMLAFYIQQAGGVMYVKQTYEFSPVDDDNIKAEILKMYTCSTR